MTSIRRLDSQSSSKAEQREALLQALTENAGNVTNTAKATGLSLARINVLLNEYELRPFATELRLKSGRAAKTGRPRGDSKTIFRK